MSACFPITRFIARAVLSGLLLGLLSLGNAVWAAVPASSAPRIGVMTMQPGEIFFERFGHDAIVAMDTRTGEATSYNFGFFDMEE
ncbi:MAG TPA: hypothetical protein VET30_01915, partial [Pseudoxanthomonas sp.]|nr:hypothetical protein [Pseudoxanthomonas sp.]